MCIFASIARAAAAHGHDFLLAFFLLFLIVNPVSGKPQILDVM
jgi:hypothetical protein